MIVLKDQHPRSCANAQNFTCRGNAIAHRRHERDVIGLGVKQLSRSVASPVKLSRRECGVQQPWLGFPLNATLASLNALRAEAGSSMRR